MQYQRAAAQKPRQQRQADAGKGRGAIAERMLASCAKRLSNSTRKARREQFGMIARDRHQAAFADIEGDRRRHARRHCSAARDRAAESGSSFSAVEQIVERHHAVGQVAAEAAHIADGKDFRRDVQRELAMIEAADSRPQVISALAPMRAERRDRVGAPPQQRQRRRDHSRAQHAEHGRGHSRRYSAIGCRRRRRSADPCARSRPAIAVTMRSASAKVSRRGAPSVNVCRFGASTSASASGRRCGAAAEQFVDGDAVCAGAEAAPLRRLGIAEDHCSVRFG